MQTRNAIHNGIGGIDCEIEHPSYGWIPFTASPDDIEPLGRELFDVLKDSAAPYVPPTPPTEQELRDQWRETAHLSPAEFFVAAKRLGMLTPEEALEAAKGTAPQSFIDLVSADPEVDEIEAQILFARMVVVERNHPFILAAIATMDIDPDAVDAAFGWQ